MFFYIDESGHTGPNLFDPTQPLLYYGVLSGSLDVDVLALERLQRLRARCGVERLHAAELGNGGLTTIAADLAELQTQLDLCFDLCIVNKPDHSVISFFDQVFDQGLNPAVTWTGYWTPLRYILLLKLATLFDEDLAKRAWNARLDLNDTRSNAALTAVCSELRTRAQEFPDARSRQLISDVLEWTEQHPSEIRYNAKTKKDRLSVMPNLIGFQMVIFDIAARLRSIQQQASRIIVDQQSQFNKAQKTLAEAYATLKSTQITIGPGLPEISLEDVPTTPIEFSSPTVSAGLELTDIYLWVFKRLIEEKELAPSLQLLVQPQLLRGEAREISLRGIATHWQHRFDELPKPTAEGENRARKIIAEDEARRLRSIGKLNPR